MPEHGNAKSIKKRELEQLLELVSQAERKPEGDAPQQALSGFAELLGGSAALIARFNKPRVRELQKGVRTGPCVSHNGIDAGRLRQTVSEAMPNCPAWERILEACDRSGDGDALVFTRSGLVTDEDWYPLELVRRHYMEHGLDRFLCVVRYLMRRKEYGALVVYRADGAGPFSRRERELAEMFWSTLGWLLVLDTDDGGGDGTDGAGPDSPRSERERQLMASLPPRLRQVLLMVLRGYTADMMAGELGLSVHTVYEHMRRLYERVGVTHRTALIAQLRGSDRADGDGDGDGDGLPTAGSEAASGGSLEKPRTNTAEARRGAGGRPPRG